MGRLTSEFAQLPVPEVLKRGIGSPGCLVALMKSR